MSDIVLSVEVRERAGTGAARETRRQGFVPGVLYGGPRGPVSIAVKSNELQKAINSGKFIANMIEIEHKGERQPVIAREIQFDPVTDFPMHFDLYRVEEDSIISVEVPVHFINEEKSPGLKRGGVLNIVRHQVEVDCPAGAIPSEITVDLTGYDIGDSIHISSVTLADNVKPTITDRDFTIATMQGSRAVIEESADEEDGAEAAGEAEAED
jgi:large subunit ribosomal protein L25